MTTEEMAAENKRLEEELRRALESIERLKRQISAPPSPRPPAEERKNLEGRKSAPTMVEIEFPGLMKITLSGEAASIMSGKEEIRNEKSARRSPKSDPT